MTTVKYTYNAPRWAKIRTAATQTTLLFNLECKVSFSKGLITEQGVIVCTGLDNDILKFKNWFKQAVEQYNS